VSATLKNKIMMHNFVRRKSLIESFSERTFWFAKQEFFTGKNHQLRNTIVDDVSLKNNSSAGRGTQASLDSV